MTVSYPSEGHDECFALDERSFWYRHRNQVLQETLRAFPPGQPFFDIGGGNGAVAMALQRGGVRVCVMEPLVSGARHARGRGVARVVCCSLEDASVRDGTVPAAGLFDVLEHIADDGAFLVRLRSLLVRDARLYVTVPAFEALRSSHDLDVGHHRRYTSRMLSERLEAAGFRVEYASYFFSPLPPAIMLFRTIPERLRASLGLAPHKPAARRTREHLARRPWMGKMLEQLLRFETWAIRRRMRLAFGSSILIVARAN
jgi:hypothetical protein